MFLTYSFKINQFFLKCKENATWELSERERKKEEGEANGFNCGVEILLLDLCGVNCEKNVCLRIIAFYACISEQMISILLS